MGGKFERVERLEHQTLGAQKLAVRSEDYWEYKPEQRVQTIDGVTGVVKHVEDGPFPGAEEYEVVLDRGLGGGRYTASQLSPAPITAEAMEQTAAVDYPELAQILVERPDPAMQFVTAAKANPPFADKDSDEDDESDDEEPDGDSDDSTGDKESDDSDDSDGDKGSDDEGDDAPPWAKKASVLFSDLVVTAATDADFRFHITAAWRDVVAKAKRIRSEGRLRVTLASDGIVVAEVKGDHHVYETGLQRMPGKMAAHAWSCGCKWGAYHWGADDDFSRFAGRMCSHALALQYEAQSRGMFGRDVHVDEHKPTWVPRHVVVRYDIDADTNRLAPSTAAARPTGSGSPLSVVARAAVAAGEDQEELLLALSVAGIRPLGNADSPFGDPAGTSYLLPRAPGATAPKKPWENPASAGPLAGGDPAGWNRQLPLQSYAAMDTALFEPGGTTATLDAEPEGALPSTDGADDSLPTDEASDLAPSMTAGLKRHALKDFTLAEQQALINEGEGVRAANLDRLDIKGTHYADLESVLAAQEEDTTWLA